MLNIRNFIHYIKYNFNIILVGFLFFILSKPYFAWNTSIGSICCIFFILWGAISIKKSDFKIAVLAVLFMILSFVNASISNLNFSGIIISVFFPFLFFITPEKRIRILESFKNIYIIFIFFSLLIFLSVYILRINIPYTQIQSLNVLKDYNYKVYPFLAMPNISFLLLPRFPALYDEPGVVGSISILLLITFNKELNKFSYIVILLSGILSFSLFFYITFILYIATVNFKRVLFVLLTIAAFVIIFPPIHDYYDNYINSRLEIDSSGSLAGDNRTTENFDKEYSVFLNSSFLLFGKGESPIASGSSSYKTIIYTRGLIFFILTFSLFTFYAISKLKNIHSLYIFIIYFVGMTYQRPFYFDPFYFFMFLTMVDYLQLKDNHNNTKSHKHVLSN